jgi:hypothetical protein
LNKVVGVPDAGAGYACTRRGDQPQAKQRERADVRAVFDRELLVHCAPHQRRFIAFDRE